MTDTIRAILLAFSIICSSATISCQLFVPELEAQQNNEEQQEEQEQDPGRRPIQKFDEQALHQHMSSKSGVVDTFVNTMRSHLGVKFAALLLTEPMIGQVAMGANQMVSAMLQNTYESDENFRDQIREAGAPLLMEQYRKCLAKYTKSNDPLAAAKVCGGGNVDAIVSEGLVGGGGDGTPPEDESQPYPGDEDNDNPDEPAQNTELTTQVTVTDMIIRWFKKDKKEHALQYQRAFQEKYGEGYIQISKDGNPIFNQNFESKDACLLAGNQQAYCDLRNGNTEQRSEYRRLMISSDGKVKTAGFFGTLLEQQYEVYKALHLFMKKKCQHVKNERNAAFNEGAFRGYGTDKFDFWYQAENEAKLSKMKNVDLSAGDTFILDKTFGDALFEVLRIDQKGIAIPEELPICSQLEEDKNYSYFAEAYDAKANGKFDELRRFYVEYAKYVGALKTLQDVAIDVRQLYELLIFDENKGVEDKALVLMNRELGSLEEIGKLSNIGDREIGNKIQIAEQHVKEKLDKLEKEVKRYVNSHTGVAGSRIGRTQRYGSAISR